eukprot:TRINITY_DN3392_c0_g2_i1.p1 TRINITY_DN3392_c0_g2~~TRINITY_DN3392_c0_g2_i1.p1  ORF type:complete len:657 (-),score=135.09 TRINITY_DN3392_c0_g2_i1:93-1979(-)
MSGSDATLGSTQSYYTAVNTKPVAAHDVDLFRQRRDVLMMHPDVMAVRARIEDIAGRWSIIKQGPIRGFDCISLGPTELREQIKRNFGVLLTARELGALVAWHDKTGDGRADCSEFTKEFYCAGHAARQRRERALAKAATLIAQQHQKRVDAKAKHMSSLKEVRVGSPTEAQRTSALSKLAAIACQYDTQKQGSLATLTQTCNMSATVFREQLKMRFGLKLSPGELGALMQEFGREGGKSIDGAQFMGHFTQLGRHERYAQLQRQRRQDEALRQRRQRHQDEVVSRLGALVAARVNWSPSDAARATALNKVAKEAAHYDRDRSIGLQNMLSGSMDVTGFNTQLRQGFGIRLSSAELGALFKVFDLDGGGTVDGAEFLNAFFKLGREERAKQLAEAERTRQRMEDKRRRFNESLQTRLVLRSTAKVEWPIMEFDPYSTRAESMIDSARSEDESPLDAALNAAGVGNTRSSPAPDNRHRSSAVAPALPPVTEATAAFLHQLDIVERSVKKMHLPGTAPPMRKARRKRRQKNFKSHEQDADAPQPQDDRVQCEQVDCSDPMGLNTEQNQQEDCQDDGEQVTKTRTAVVAPEPRQLHAEVAVMEGKMRPDTCSTAGSGYGGDGFETDEGAEP